jgi:iron(III) transport system ATP-binding protein
MSAGAVALRVRGLTKRFAGKAAVDAVDLDVEEGGFTCLIGPSGCGKTTLLRMLAGLETANAGSVEIEGRDVSAASPAERGVGMVFQSYALFPNMTVASNVGFGAAKTLKRAELDAKVEALLRTVGLEGYDRRRPHELSGGQQQRVAIARALATEPRILLLDEPLSALDPLIRDQLRAELKALQRRLGVTTVMVTHDQAEALAVADTIAVMRSGRIEQVGSPETIYQEPASLFVAAFVGAANVLEGRISAPGSLRLWDGVEVPADTRSGAPGAQVLAAIRPESVRLARPGEKGLPAKVVDRRFAGATTRLEAEPEGAPGKRLSLDLPAATAPALGPGEHVALVLPPDRIRLFAHEGASCP